MDNKKNGIPKLRFPGFTGAWEQRKLGEVATRVTRKNKNLESTLPLTISARLGLVDQISYFDKRIASSNLTNYILLNRGEFAYNKSYSNGYPFGTVKRLNRYDKGVIPSLYIAFMPNTIFINSDFMEMYFETSLWHKEVSARASEGARNHGLLNISPSDFMDIYMKIPEKIEEQKKIAKFLEDFDFLIALHQRKLEHLQEQKKGLLQKMFPKNGETVPEVRFPGFTDAWEQRKLSSMTQYKNGKGHEDKQTDSGDFELVNLNSISIDGGFKHSGKFINESDDGILYKNDLVMILSDVGHGDLLGRVALIPDDNKFILNQRVALLRPNKTVNPGFLFFYINSHQKYFKSQGAGMSQLNISKKSVETFSSLVPNIDEQKKISLFLMKLDSLIALHQRKLEHLELMKKGLLQQMFV
ncbi:restriction endonuclease subunit S [Ligilactobacillus salivarius]|uniref:restriction endonuclease subunit S n=1 Tax=Ligilactobacillus salivarius TaxID=1624 RepID=UPI0024B90AB5|nr:restriction endonuclease subunit S [Ligilactobacillus salivarius]